MVARDLVRDTYYLSLLIESWRNPQDIKRQSSLSQQNLQQVAMNLKSLNSFAVVLMIYFSNLGGRKTL